MTRGGRRSTSRAVLAVLLLNACAETPTESGRDPLVYAKAAGTVTVTAAVPDVAQQGVTLNVQVLGSGFDRGSLVDFALEGVVAPELRVNSTTYRNGGELIANVTVALDALPARYDVIVTTTRGKKGIGTERFAVVVPYETLQSTALSSQVARVSPTGWLAGFLDFNDPCPPYTQPSVWTPTGELRRLPLPSGTCAGRPRGINGDGVLVGTAYTTPSQRVSLRWSPQGDGYAMLLLPPLPSGMDSDARSVNAAGAISATQDAAIWTEAAGWRLLGIPAGSANCGATLLNDLGEAVATCQSPDLTNRVAFWASLDAAPVVLPLPAGASSANVTGLNGTGTVVGYTTGAVPLPVRWTRAGSTWTAEVLPHLGQGGRADDVNDAGIIVGRAANKNGTPRPVYWTSGAGLRMLGTGSRGEGAAISVSAGSSGVVIGGYLRTGKSVTDYLAVRWRP